MPCAWRFWARGSKKENLVCGLIRDSSDSLGRPYPLLIIGTGPLRGLEENWDLLPFACEGTWSQMESLSSRMLSDLQHLGDEIERLNPPQPQWSEFKNVDDRNLPQGIEALKNRIKTVAKENSIFVPLDENLLEDPLRLIHLYHSFLKSHLPEMVTTAFMGGDPLKTWLAFFRRPLITEDFIRLWSLDQW